MERVEFIDGAIEAIAALNRAGIPVAVVTNQAGVARGYYGIEDVQQVHKHMIAELARKGAHVDLWLFCPYHPEGMVEAFARSSSRPQARARHGAGGRQDARPGSRLVVGGGGQPTPTSGWPVAVGARPLLRRSAPTGPTPA